MSALVKYVLEHTERNACTCGKCVVSGEDRIMSGHTIDLFFFDVSAKNSPDADTLKKLVAEHKGEFDDVNPYDGQEHSYIELGGWIGDQGIAMMFMGLSVALGLGQVMHPVNMLKLERNHPLAQQMAGMGMVAFMGKK